ncbi:DNA alkylation repair protein [Arenimonas oryziterrae]|uniref:DNA alkylation repair protein n=1 Tax=Arenimonas oryziterrae DSM 21050 = YC6267 TaxID=1121015 RepID=A0A091AUI2_9GAMM|nr:DNA alkylation repair protein [Arenimonas oryziterrae]KFN43903.1 hypothetical protein N789_08115 [Arenimonas oryziterrae DSM 21050 = YC6267]
MSEPFKNLINPARIREAGHHLARVWPAFDRRRFEKLALAQLDTLELKARAMQIADALEATLPEEFSQAADIIEAALGPAGEGDELGFATSDAGLAGWICWSLGEFVARQGHKHPKRAFAALHALTQRFSAEFAIRPLLLQHPELGYQTLEQWTRDPSAHVRRLASEGSRPRLPWGLQLKPLIADPTPSLPLLRALQDDASAYVRRSVANHLNDIGKDHPEHVADWLDAHLPDAGKERRALLRHASRSLIKQGHPRILAAWGLGAPFKGEAALTITPKRVRIGGEVVLTLSLTSRARNAQTLAIDYLVHYIKANGQSSPKVFKGWQLTLAPGETRVLTKKHSLRVITTRVYYPGVQRVEVQVNGKVVAEAEFVLQR